VSTRLEDSEPEKPAAKEALVVGGTSVAPGEEAIIDMPVADLYTHARLTLPVHVINGKRPGPTLFVTAAIHGDELNGVDVIRRLLKQREMRRLRGQLIAVPIVNVFGFINRSRYLPDRRDLNRSFPGRERGSVAARLAHLVTDEIISKANYGIDLHTGPIGRTNLPHVRGTLADPKVLELAKAFSCPVILDTGLIEGSLREYATGRGIPIITYEAGEALRFDEVSIRAGLRGVRRVMRALDMLPPSNAGKSRAPTFEPVISVSTTWVRAPGSGIVHAECRLGERVSRGQLLATIGDPFGDNQAEVAAPASGIVIGRSTLPLAHEGDALFHIAQFDDTKVAEETVGGFQEAHSIDGSWG
jgi:uncharacterized protein